MARQAAPIYAFNAGEVSKNALARVDLAKMRMAAQCQVNWDPLVVGPAMLRPGMVYIGDTYTDAAAKLIPFVFSKTDTALLELTPNIMRVWINEVLLSRVSVATTVSDPTFAGGGTWSTSLTTTGSSVSIGGGVCTFSAIIGGTAELTQTLSVAGGDIGKEHGLRVVVSFGPVTIQIGSAAGTSDLLAQTSIDIGTHSLAFTPTGGSAYVQIWSSDPVIKQLTGVSIESSGVVTVPTPWGANDLFNMRWDQSGDIVYVACYGIQARMIQRRGVRPSARGWSVVKYQGIDGPFHAGSDAPTISLAPDSFAPNANVNASQPFFTANHVGAMLRLFSPGQSVSNNVGTANTFTQPIHVSGIGNDRTIGISVTGTWSGAWALQRSLIGPDDGFSTITISDVGFPTAPTASTFTANIQTNYNDNGWSTSTTVDLNHSAHTSWDNVDAWYRIGFGLAASFTASMSSGLLNVTAVSSGGSLSNGQLITGAGIPANTFITASYGGGGAGYYQTNASGTTVGSEAMTAGFTGTATFSMSNPTGGWYGTGRIVIYTNPTQVQLQVLSPFSSLAPTFLWQISDWCAAYGWPTSVAFHEGRLWWFSGGQIPIAGSVSNDYDSYAEADLYGNSLGDSAAILESFGSGPSDTVSWGLSLTRLLLGREQSIASARSSNFDQAMTPTDFVVRDCSDQGANRLPAVKVGKRGIYVHQTTRRVYELSFSPQEFDYDDRDLTRLNIDIGVPGFVSIAKATQPDKRVFLPRGDGQCAVLLYDVKDEVEAWWRIMTLGNITDVCVLPSDGRATAGEALEDLVYFVVQRVINGSTKYFIERLARRDQCVGGSLNYQVDAAITHVGSSTSSLTASWLPSTSIAVWADGAFIGVIQTDGSGTFSMPDGHSHTNVVAGLYGNIYIGSTNNPLSNNVTPGQVFSSPQGTLTVPSQYNGYPAEVFADIGGTGRPVQHIGSITAASATITLPNNQVASTIVACFGYVAPFMSAKLAYAAAGPTALVQKKKIDHVGLILFDTATSGTFSLQVGQDMSVLDAMPLVEADQTTPAGTVWSEYDAVPMEIPGSWDTDARLCLIAQAPQPVMLGAAVVVVETSEVAPPQQG